MKKLNNFIVLFLLSCLLFACATDANQIGVVIGGDTYQQQTVDKPTLDQLLYNRGSMTEQLEGLDSDLTVDVLNSVVKNNKFERTVSLNLDNEPVLVGVSIARRTSPYFVKILKNANTTPIGKVLFAEDSKIKRDNNMPVEEVSVSSIKEDLVKGYLYGLGYMEDDIIYKRVSTFRHKKQSMQLIEYILPAINQFL